MHHRADGLCCEVHRPKATIIDVLTLRPWSTRTEGRGQARVRELKARLRRCKLHEVPEPHDVRRLELVALLAEIGAKVLELRVQVLACGGLHRDAACARLLQQLAH
jgi:hypothetical protein